MWFTDLPSSESKYQKHKLSGEWQSSGRDSEIKVERERQKKKRGDLGDLSRRCQWNGYDHVKTNIREKESSRFFNEFIKVDLKIRMCDNIPRVLVTKKIKIKTIENENYYYIEEWRSTQVSVTMCLVPFFYIVRIVLSFKAFHVIIT